MNDRDYKKDWEEFWKGICTNDGEVDLEQIKKELSDYHFLLEELPKLYSDLTLGLLSKQNYDAATIIQIHNEKFDCRMKPCDDECRNCGDTMINGDHVLCKECARDEWESYE